MQEATRQAQEEARAIAERDRAEARAARARRRGERSKRWDLRTEALTLKLRRAGPARPESRRRGSEAGRRDASCRSRSLGAGARPLRPGARARRARRSQRAEQRRALRLEGPDARRARAGGVDRDRAGPRPGRRRLGALQGRARSAQASTSSRCARSRPSAPSPVVCAGAAVALAASQFADYRGVAVGAPAYEGEIGTVAPAPLTDLETAGSAHAYALVPSRRSRCSWPWLTARGRWRLGRVVGLIGLAGIVVGLAIDMPAGPRLRRLRRLLPGHRRRG